MNLIKTKHIARVMLVILLLTSVMNLSGCTRSQMVKGQYYEQSYVDHSVSLRIISNSEIFDLNNVTFQLNIGLHKREYSIIDWFTNDAEKLLSKTYDVSKIPDYNENLYFVVYISSPDLKEIDRNDNLLNCVDIFKEISYEESLINGKYNYSRMPLFDETFYNNCESIVVPDKYFIEGEYHTVYIGVCLVEKTNGEYSFPIDMAEIGLSYAIDANGIVRIDFRNIK